MTNKTLKILAMTAFAIGMTTMGARAANCEGRRDTGTAVGAVGGGVVGNVASHGSLGGTVAGAVIGGVASNVIGGSDCSNHRENVREDHRWYHDERGRDYYVDRDGHRHYR